MLDGSLSDHQAFSSCEEKNLKRSSFNHQNEQGFLHKWIKQKRTNHLPRLKIFLKFLHNKLFEVRKFRAVVVQVLPLELLP